MSWCPSKTAIALVIAVGLGMGIAAAAMDYPNWSIAQISLLGSAGAVVAVTVLE